MTTRFIRAIAHIGLIGLAALMGAATMSAGCRHVSGGFGPGDRHVRWEWSDGWRQVRVDAQGLVELTDDGRDVKSVSPGGRFELSSREWLSIGGPRYVVRGDADGTLSRRLTVRGRERPIDEAARAWIEAAIEKLARGGFDVESRVARILASRGAAGVLDDIPRLSGDFVKARYFRQLFERAALDGPTAQRALRLIKENISSDFERARVLTAFAAAVPLDETLAPLFVDATSSISSDFEHARVLTALLTRGGPSPVAVRVALLSARTLQSDVQRQRVLMEIVRLDAVNSGTRDLFFDALHSMGSDFERGRVLLALAKKRDIERDTVLDVVKSTAGMGSDFQKARVLLQVIAVQPTGGATRQALLDAAGGIGSEHERGRVLSALFRSRVDSPSSPDSP